MKKQPITIILDEPIIFGSETITEIKLSVPKAKHIKDINMQALGMKDILKITSKLSLISETALDELSIDDVIKVSDALGNLLASGPEIGKSPSEI